MAVSNAVGYIHAPMSPKAQHTAHGPAPLPEDSDTRESSLDRRKSRGQGLPGCQLEQMHLILGHDYAILQPGRLAWGAGLEAQVPLPDAQRACM